MHRLLRAVWVVTAAAVVGAAIAAGVSVVGHIGDTDVRTIMSLVAVALCGGAAIAALSLLDRGRLPILAGAVLATAPLELTLLLLGIWKSPLGDGAESDWWKLVPTGLAWVLATLVVATLPLMTDDRRLLTSLLPAVGACAVTGAALATVLVLAESDSETWGKTLGVLAIATVAGYLLTPISERLLRGQARDPEKPRRGHPAAGT
jgi:hypothetical protein